MSIEVTKLTKVFDRQIAVNNISFEIKSGEIVGFLGPNGAGKSTSMKMLSCFLPPTSGTAVVNGFDTVTNAMSVKSSVGYLPEHNPLYADMYVKEYLRFIGGFYHLKQIRKRVDEMIDRTGLKDERHKKIGQLSKGYRQRVGLAQAMLHNPKVLILDEPTSGLDPNQIVEIRKLIAQLGSDKTVLLSTHIMQEVEAICKRVIIINKGIIVADDSTETLRKSMNLQTRYTVHFKQAVQIELLNTIQGVTGIQSISETGYVLSCQPNEPMQERIFQAAVKNNLIITELKQELNSMEDVFKSFTGN